jgi:hypothetical protein
MNIDPQYVDKQKDLEAIFEIAYTQGLPLSGEHGAIALAQRMSRASFYIIPAEVRETVREDVEQRIDAERAEEKRVLAALRLARAQEIERRSLQFMQVLLDRLEARIADEDIADKNLAELGKLYLDVTRNNVTPEYVTEPVDDEPEIPRFPIVPPIARLPLLASDDPITEFTATARTASGVQVTVSTPDRSDAVEGQIIDQAD